MRLFCGIFLMCLLVGCQSINKITFYEPNEENAAYCVPAEGGKSGYGPIKSIESKNGIRDWWQNTNIKTSISVLGL